jgi:hypothetical protein
MVLFDMQRISEILGSINPWKVATVFLLLVNVKCLPFVWHVRVMTESQFKSKAQLTIV